MISGYLAKIPLFRALPAVQRKRLSECCELRRFRKGDVLFEEGDPAASVWLIQQGWVYLIKRTPQGASVTVFTVTPEELLCGFSSTVGQEAYFASAVAATTTTAIRVPRGEFTGLLRRQPQFATQVLAIYHTRMRHMAEAISLAQAPVEQRLAYTLLRLQHTFGATIPVTHHELARMAGTRWETSIRTLAHFRRRRWMSTSRGRMTVLRADHLQALLVPDKKYDVRH